MLSNFWDMKLNNVQWVELGEYISQSDARNSLGEYTVDDVRGLSVQKKITETKANMEGVSVLSYKLLKPRQFAYVPDTSRRGDKMSLGYNETDDTFLVSSISCVFEVSKPHILLPEFLYLFYCRPEFDRYARFNSWGSAREAFSFEDMKRVRIPLPSIEVQRTIVDAWKSLRNIKEQNEALAAPLMQLCQSYIQECKHKYESKELRSYIDEVNVRNDKENYGEDELRGVTSSGVFDESRASTDGLIYKNYKIVNSSQFAYNPSRINLGSIAINQGDPCIISPMYVVFEIVKQDELLPEYLALWTRRKEFQRSTLFYASGSVRDTFGFENMRNTKVPIPPIDVQKAIISLYQSALEYKSIAAEADAQARSICSALMQHAINKN